MSGLVLDVLPGAVGIAISPVALIVVIVLVLAADRRRAVAFAAGWVIGLTLVTTVGFFVGNALGLRSEGLVSPVAGIIQLTAGIIIIALLLREWMRRARPDGHLQLSTWEERVGELTAKGAFRFALSLVLASPKSLSLSLVAGLLISAGPTGMSVWTAGVFIAVAVSTVVAPLLWLLFGRGERDERLRALRDWLIVHEIPVATSVLAILTANYLRGAVFAF